MNITLFGGSFNPPTLGHQIIIDQILKLKLVPGLDELWLLPEYRHSFAKNRELIASGHRLKMTKFLVRPGVKLQTACIDKKMSGDTIEHIIFLKEKYPQDKFSFLIGSDNLANFNQWPQYQTLLELMTFYVYPRRGFPFRLLYENMVPLTHPRQIISEISSTMVRQKLEKDEDCTKLLPPKVAEYIRQKRLFLPV